MKSKTIYDIIGIGIGPFNLGLAALCFAIPELNCLFIDGCESFNWHPGLLLPETRLQVPYYADLVTLADPCSAFTYMAFLKAKQRLFRFAIHEHEFVTRKEYNQYCQWVAAQLPSLRFGCSCNNIRFNEQENIYYIETNTGIFYAKQVVIGTGTIPALPKFAQGLDNAMVHHSSQYLYVKEQLVQKESITIVGSGQSAAEIFYDLLQAFKGQCYWFTRSSHYIPMEYSKLNLEMSTPDYINYFHSLNPQIKEKLVGSQSNLYKGINQSLINRIYDDLYYKELDNDGPSNFQLHTNCELKSLTQSQSNQSQNLSLEFQHLTIQENFNYQTDALISR